MPCSIQFNSKPLLHFNLIPVWFSVHRRCNSNSIHQQSLFFFNSKFAKVNFESKVSVLCKWESWYRHGSGCTIALFGTHRYNYRAATLHKTCTDQQANRYKDSGRIQDQQSMCWQYTSNTLTVANWNSHLVMLCCLVLSTHECSPYLEAIDSW